MRGCFGATFYGPWSNLDPAEMVRISFLTHGEEHAIRLAKYLSTDPLVLFLTMERHEELTFDGDKAIRTPMVHLSGMTRHLLYRRIAEEAERQLGNALVRTWAEAVTNLDPRTTRELLERTPNA